jgi:membrane protease YdiL (CAAX protease family)
MSGIEFQVHAILFALCVAFLLLAGGVYASRFTLPQIAAPEGKGRVPVEGFGLVDVAGVMLFVMFYASGMFVAGKEPELTPFTLVVALYFQGGMAGFVLLLLFWRIRVIDLWGLRWKKWWMALLAIPAVFVMWSFMAVLDQSGYNAWITELVGGDTTQEMVKALQEETNIVVLALMSLVTVIGAPVSEEIIFRGYIYPATKRLSGSPCAVLFSGALFAVVHLNLAALLPLFVLGMLLAVLYEATGSLWMPIAVHLVFNLGTVVMQQLMRLNPELFEVEPVKKAGEAAVLWFG